MEHAGMANVRIGMGQTHTKAEIFVTSEDTVPILGLKACKELGIVKKGHNAASIDTVSSNSDKPITRDILKDEYTVAFEGHGEYPGDYHITLIENPDCQIEAPKRIAHCLREPLKQKLRELESKNIIARTEEPTDWVHNLVIVQKKDGSLRLCLSPKSLNACIKREHYQIPVLEDVLPELAGKSVFSVLYLKDAYWQIKLDDESSYLCTFNTPFGCFRFLKMPFGISSAAEVLQRKTHQVFGDISGVHIIADDMLIAAENEAEHDQIMRRVLERGIQKNIKFNFSKLKLKQPSVEYNGVIISAQGQRPDPKKVNAIAEMPDPTDKE